MRALLILAILFCAAGCKESPEAAAKRIRDTMEAMQRQEQAEAEANSAAMHKLLANHGATIKVGMAESKIHKLLGDPSASRSLKDGTEAQVWIGTSDEKQVSLSVTVRDGVAESVDFRP